MGAGENGAACWEKKFQVCEFAYPGGNGLLKYHLYVPENIEGRLPVVLFLHGAGERGDDNEKQLTKGFPPHYFGSGSYEKYPAIIVAPQCPEDKRWVETDWGRGSYDMAETGESDLLRAVFELMEHLCRTLPADTDRVYVTGISMGGFGTWDIAVRHPEMFAAALPVCGGADPREVHRMCGIPTLTFHGSDDDIVPAGGTEAAATALEEAGGRVRFVEYPPGLGHGCWDAAYGDTDTFSWLFSNRKGKI